jgi:uncharacterized protein YsxB (DUF464 family)
MTSVIFYTRNNTFAGFEISGHSGYSESSSDIICAALSAMTSLVVTALENSGHKYSFNADEKIPKAVLVAETPTAISENLFQSLYREAAELSREYPKYVAVKKREYHKGVN